MSGHNHDDRQPITPETVDWDEMYRQNEAMWSGQVNGSLAVEVENLSPGRALDVGCGEGADAIWLAERGWDVVAIDISSTAVERGRLEAESRGVAIEWLATDILNSPPEPGSFELVSLHYPAFAAARHDDVVKALTDAVAVEGTLLLVGHAPPSDPEASSFDPSDWVAVGDVADELGDLEHWDVEANETRPRLGAHHHESPHTHDVVLRAKRLTT